MARSMGRTDGHVITNGIVIVNIMFGVCIADCRRVPVHFQGFRIVPLAWIVPGAVSFSC
jgi:hypothetical protein